MTKQVILCIALAALLLWSGTALGQGSASYGLWWNAVPSGGGHSASSGFVLDGSAGQYTAGLATSGSYQLGGGFVYGFVAAALPPPGPNRLYLPLLTRNV